MLKQAVTNFINISGEIGLVYSSGDMMGMVQEVTGIDRNDQIGKFKVETEISDSGEETSVRVYMLNELYDDLTTYAKALFKELDGLKPFEIEPIKETKETEKSRI